MTNLQRPKINERRTDCTSKGRTARLTYASPSLGEITRTSTEHSQPRLQGTGPSRDLFHKTKPWVNTSPSRDVSNNDLSTLLCNPSVTHQ
eukprot:1718332-Amphidinium_carterae.1